MAAGPVSRLNRRGILRAAGVVAAGLAGCTGSVTAPTDAPAGTSGFEPAVRDRARTAGRRHRRAVIVLQPPDSAASGTAWFLGDGHLVTNSHVIDELGTDELVGHDLDGSRFDVAVEHRVDTPDLALLSAAIDPPGTLPAGQSTALTSDQPLVQIGHTRLGYWTIALGRFKRRVQHIGRAWVLTEMPVALGNSGSALLTLEGRAVGLTFGTVPKRGAVPDRAPQPSLPTVYETYPRQRIEFGGHLAIETVEEYVDRWTTGKTSTDGS